MRFMFACGGTAGHINPAIAVAGRLRELMPDCEILFVGCVRQMETVLVPKSGYDIKTVRVCNISREKTLGGLAHNIKALYFAVKSTIQARRIIKKFKPDIVIGTGGYVCYPVLRSASRLGIPTAVHESNAVPGLTTKMLSKIVDKIMLGFAESKRYYKHSDKCVVTGTPVRGEFATYSKSKAKAELGIPADKPLVVSVWGSLGAANMNAAMCKFIKLAGKNPGFRLIHSAGSEGYAEMVTALQETVPDYEKNGMDVREYIYDMPRVMAAADLVLCRAGASTVSELTYMHKPTIFVPSPYVTNNHQFKNAKVVEDAGGALIFEEESLDAGALLNEVKRILSSKDELEKMSQAMAKLARPEATDMITEQVLSLCQGIEK